MTAGEGEFEGNATWKGRRIVTERRIKGVSRKYVPQSEIPAGDEVNVCEREGDSFKLECGRAERVREAHLRECSDIGQSLGER